ncbi:MAG TPA: HEAT repeat domain-containing protein [Methylomirabilota bacterium]|jgi:hypothetical protein
MATRTVTLDQLREALHGGRSDIAQGEAFALLAASSFPEREVLLGSVLQDRREPTAVRSAAAIALGRIPTRESEQILLTNLAAEEWRVQVEVLRALGKIGGAEALAAIDRLRLPAEDPGGAAFAASLIAHRLRLPGHELPLPPGERLLKVPEERAHAIRVSPLPPELARKAILDLARQPYGVEYDENRLVRLECVRRVNVVCPNRQLTEAGQVARLRERKAVAAVVALQSPETGDYSVSYIVMVAPAGSAGRVQIIAPRCSGRPGLAGTGNVVDDRLAFELRTVERPGAFPMELSGELVTGEIRFRRAVVSPEQTPSRRPGLLRR